MPQIQLVSTAVRAVDVDEAEYREARAAGELDQMLDTDASNMDPDIRIIEPASLGGQVRDYSTGQPIQDATTRTVIITGANDDLIEIGGPTIREEFTYQNDDDKGDLVSLSDGTVLRIVFSEVGVWRITTVAQGSASLTIEQTTEDGLTDVATVVGEVRWVVHGRAYVPAKD